MNELSVTDQESIVGLLRLGWSARRVSRETGHRRETIARYGRAAGLLGSKPPTPAKVPTDLEPLAKPAQSGELVQFQVATDLRFSRSSAREHAAFIEAELAKGRNAVAIYQDLIGNARLGAHTQMIHLPQRHRVTRSRDVNR